MSTIAEQLASNLQIAKNSTWTASLTDSGIPLLFPKDYISEHYRLLFDIPEEEKEIFHNAFRTVSEGVGNEIAKINSVASSSLLCLLAFYRLTQDGNDYVLKIPNIPALEGLSFTKCFFEIRNKVIGKPSCVDIVLVDTNKGVLLFLESKLSEYLETSHKEEYGKSYIPLYMEETINGILKNYDIFARQNQRGELELLFGESSSDKAYIEGIKQSISHLIGIYQGPQDQKTDSYDPKNYMYWFERAQKIYYGTIIYSPMSEPNKYIELYEGIIGANGSEIMNAIKRCKKDGVKNAFKEYANRKIEVLSEVLTYQSLFSIYENSRLLTPTVKMFYNL
ncbi:MAG: hypothetical protein JFR38_03180 [Muribaculaceae bacterium]|nr:hypothetical protein [Muribaculaceae bacterium]